MRSFFTSTPLLFLAAVLLVVFSIYLDFDNDNWLWFQRSGSVIVLVGAILSYRSIVRLGVQGVGSGSMQLVMGTIVSTDSTGPMQTVKIAYDDETLRAMAQERADRFAGYIGAYMIVLGTLIWGYGDLLGRVI